MGLSYPSGALGSLLRHGQGKAQAFSTPRAITAEARPGPGTRTFTFVAGRSLGRAWGSWPCHWSLGDPGLETDGHDGTPPQQRLHHLGLPPLLGGCEHHSALAALKTLDFQAASLPPVTMPSQGGAHRRSLLLMKPQENKRPTAYQGGPLPSACHPSSPPQPVLDGRRWSCGPAMSPL